MEAIKTNYKIRKSKRLRGIVMPDHGMPTSSMEQLVLIDHNGEEVFLIPSELTKQLYWFCWHEVEVVGDLLELNDHSVFDLKKYRVIESDDGNADLDYDYFPYEIKQRATADGPRY